MGKIPDTIKPLQDRNVLDTDRIGSLLVKLAMPAFFGMFVQTLYNVINTIFVGNFIDPNPETGMLAIAGLSIVFPLQMLAWGVGMMVGMGGSSLISRCLGSRRIEDAERTVGNGISLSIILAILIMIMILPFTDFWLKLIGASDAVLPYARPYLIIILSGNIFSVVANSLLNYSRAEGNARVGMVAMIIGAVLSIILDAIFIIVLKMGVTGAALATVISQIVSMVYLGSYYLSGSSYLNIRWRNLRLDWIILKQMMAIGVGSFVQTVASSISSMILIREVVFYGGDTYLSAFGIIQRLMMFATMPAMVIGQGVQPILGFNYGARRFGLALKALKIAATVSTTLSLFAFVILYSIPGPIIKIFNSDVALMEAGIRVSHLVFWSMPLMGLVMVGSTSFMSIGKAVQAFITAAARPILFLIPAVLVLPRLLGLNGVFLAFPTSDAFTLVLTVLLIIPVIRQFRKAAKEQQEVRPGVLPPGGLLESVEHGRINEP
jgi:putative MATE family efflux protein